MNEINPLIKTQLIPKTNIYGKYIFVLVVVIIFVLLLNLGIYLINNWGTASNNIPTPLRTGITSGLAPSSITQDPTTNPDKYILRSNGRDYGNESTWSIWLYVNNTSQKNKRHNKFQHIFNKGNNQYDSVSGIATINNAPAVYLLNNSLRIMMDTIIIPISIDVTNIPIDRWFNLTIRSKHRDIDVYINGIIASHAYLMNAPKYNYDPIYICQNGGFSGKYSDLYYYNYALNTFQIQSLLINGPKLITSSPSENSDYISQTTFNSYLASLWDFTPKTSDIDISLNTIHNPIVFVSPTVIHPDPVPFKIPQITTQSLETTPAILKTADNDASANLIKNEVIIAPIKPVESTVGVVQQTINQIIKSIPFSLNMQLFTTSFADIMSGDVRALKQHNLDCVGNAMNSFQYINAGDGTFNYNYKCNNPKGGNMTEIVPKTTEITNSTGKTSDLVNQNVQCPTNSVLSQFQLFMGQDDNTLQYKYKCLKSSESGIQPLSCRNVTTPSTRTNDSSQFLSKSNITCNADEALSGFQYVLDGTNQYHYNYTCCKTPYSSG